MNLICLTGGIGAGKSTVLGIFQELGCFTLDADDIVHELYSPGRQLYKAVAERWGGKVITETGVDKAGIANIVFNDNNELSWLNSISHPIVLSEIKERCKASQNNLCCCAVPLLYETGWEVEFDTIISIWCDELTQYKRLQERGWTDTEIKRRINNQLSMDEKLKRAEYGIINTCTLDILKEQCQEILNKLTRM